MIRPWCASNAAGCGAVYHAAVHEGTRADYDAAQRAAWSPGPELPAGVIQRLAEQFSLVSEGPDGIDGFMTLRADGHLDFAYVRPGAMGTGLAGRLHDAILTEAQARALPRLTTEASHLARRFFLKHDWREVAAQGVLRGGVEIPNFRMALERHTNSTRT